MKQKSGLFAGAMLLTAMLSLSSSQAVNIFFQDVPQGDTLSVIPFFPEELGPNPPFDPEFSVAVRDPFGLDDPYNPVTTTSSLVATDGAGLNVILEITNTSGVLWEELWYVADGLPGGANTMITNYDGYVATIPNDPNVSQLLTFKIDSFGDNTPLQFESMTSDSIFEIGETWQFILQDFTSNVQFQEIGSLGLGDGASGEPSATLSSGSIIARNSSTGIPEPSRALLLLLGVISVASVRRRR